MTPAQAALHADRKDKLEKAMGVKKKEEELKAEAAREAALSPEERRQKLKNAVEGGDWSAVIEGQTKETLPVAPGRTVEASDSAAAAVSAAAAAAPAQTNRPVTPFARASVHRAVGGGNGGEGKANSSSSPSSPSSPSNDEPFVLTVEAAEAALDEVRPYLIADGGNVEVVEVVAEEGEGNEEGKSYVVRVMLQGACGTCGSASATMAMGIERALKATFGSSVSRVERVANSYGMEAVEAAEKAAASAPNSVTVDAIDGLLDGLRPAIAAYEGSVEVLSVSADAPAVATLRYSGPDSIGVGIVMAVKDRFPGLADVKLVSG
jgi:Fe-S cluster biogenesis protein NfuA